MDIIDRNIVIAERIKKICIQAAVQGYESASISGLCHEGAWEAAISAMQRIDIKEIINAQN